MFRAVWLAAVAMLVPSFAHADPAVLCAYSITAPADGATAVPLDSAIVGLTNCQAQQPLFVDDLGKTVAAELQLADGKFKLQPKAPLQADRSFTVTFSTHQTCGSMDGKATFATAAKPGVRLVKFADAAGELHAATVHLTEPVANPSDLAEGSSWISAKVDGYALAPQVQEGPKWASSYVLYYKNNAQKPAMSARLTVTLRQGLKFASGAVLAKDVEVSMVPADLPFGWAVTGLRQPCEARPDPSCSSGQSGRVGAGAALLAGVVALVVGWRRRVRVGGGGDWSAR